MSIASALSSTPSGSLADVVSKRTQLSQKEFFKVLTAQMTQQNPLDPMDSQDFLAQLVQLQNLEVTSDLSKNFAGMISQNAFTSASALLGKIVTGTQADGSTVTDVVSRVTVDGGKVRLAVGNATVALENVTEVVDPFLPPL